MRTRHARIVYPLPALLTAIAALTTILATPARAADVSVTGNLIGTQHSPAVAINSWSTYVVAYDRVTGSSGDDRVSLWSSNDGGATFAERDLPTLPSGWLWTPDADIAYENGNDVFWLVSQARNPSLGRFGVFVANGTPQADGSILWDGIAQIDDAAALSSFVPALAIAAPLATGYAHVLHADPQGLSGDEIHVFRVPTSLVGISVDLLASEGGGVTSLSGPEIAASQDGRVLAMWSKISGTGDVQPIVGRESADGGVTFGPEFTVTEQTFSGDGPGATQGVGYPLSAMYAKTDPFAPETRVLFYLSQYPFYPSQIDPMDVRVVNSYDPDPAIWNPFGGILQRGYGFWEVLPAAVFAEDGYFYIGWHDFEPFAPDSLSRFMVQRVWNGGYGAGPMAPLASATFDWNTVLSNLGGMGWRSGVDARFGKVTFAWADHRDGSPDVRSNSFHAEGLLIEPSAGAPDTVDATPGSTASFALHLANRNSLFSDDYSYGLTGPRPWLLDLVPGQITLGPEGTADVFFDVAVPDSAANAVHLVSVYAFDLTGFKSYVRYLRISGSLVAAPGDPALLAREVALGSPRPNPSDGPASLTYTLPAEADIELAVFDLRGRRVATVARGRRPAGTHAEVWSGRGELAGPGVYFARLTVRSPGGDTSVVRETRLVRLR